MGFKLNLTQDEIKKSVEGRTFKPIPEGVYGAVIYSATEGKSKSSGNDMYTIVFKITDGPDSINRRVTGYYTITTDSLWNIIDLHKAIDFPYPDKDTPAGEFDFPDADEYLGHKVNIKIVHKPYDSVDEATGEQVTRFDAKIARVFPYDPDKVTGAEVESADSGLFLK